MHMGKRRLSGHHTDRRDRIVGRKIQLLMIIAAVFFFFTDARAAMAPDGEPDINRDNDTNESDWYSL